MTAIRALRRAMPQAPRRRIASVASRIGPRWTRALLLGATGGLLAATVGVVVIGATSKGWLTDPGGDYLGYMAATRRWLAGDGFYLARQLAGPYPIELGDVLYPPTSLWLFVPFAFLPWVLWWAIPIGLTSWLIRRWRPQLWAWPFMAACLAWPESPFMLFRGTPTIWMVAAVAAGLRLGWPGAFVLLKPSLAPFALIGIRSRGWWIAVALLVVLTLPVLGMVPDWLRAILDGQGRGGLLYSAKDVPLMLLPVVAWLGRRRDASAAAAEQPRRLAADAPA